MSGRVRTTRRAARTRAVLLAFAIALSTTTAWAQSASTDTQQIEPDPQSAAYWLRNREGWFWYRDPPVAAPRPAPPASKPPRELADFEAMQKRLEDLKRVAVMNPTDANLTAYMRYQRMVMDKSEHFAERWQRLVWTVPDLDYGLSGRPTNAMAINVFDEQQRERQAQTIKSLAATHGLIFVFRGDCPHCHRFAPILKRFEQEFGFTVLAISMDGRAIPEYPNARPDNGMAARLNATAVPALYLTAPATRQIVPVGFGVMSMTDLVERIAALAQDAPAGNRQP
ncbi:MAG: conjugal transfer protein TraF [Candidatus Accumulibacter similis]|nr:MAG: conjugal transfer protein TraF [Candidatus Accumulibacter similis]